MRRAKLSEIARRHRLRAVVLFGSRATGHARPDSDCDLCVSVSTLPVDEMRLIRELSEALSADVDLSVFERIGPSLKYTVAREGKLLFGTRADWDRLRLRAISEWQDSARFLGATRAYLDRALG